MERMDKNGHVGGALLEQPTLPQDDPLLLLRRGQPARERVLYAAARTLSDIILMFNSPDSPYRQGMVRNELIVENLRQMLGELAWGHFHRDNQARFASPDAAAAHSLQLIVATGRREDASFVFDHAKGPATRGFVRVSEEGVLPNVVAEEASAAQPIVLLMAKEWVRDAGGGKLRRALRLYAVHAKALGADGLALYYHDYIDLGVVDPSSVPPRDVPMPAAVTVKPTLGNVRTAPTTPIDGPGT